MAGTSVTYSPITRGQESLTQKFYIGDTLFAMLGCKANASFMMDASSNPKIKFDFLGQFVLPEEAVRPTGSYDDWKRAIAVTSANSAPVSIGGTDLLTRNFKVDLGNEVTPRFLVGAENVEITGRSEMIECQVQAVPLTDFDPFANGINAAELEVEFVHGKTVGNIFTFNAPRAQQQRPGSPVQVDGITEWPLTFKPNLVNGNDQWTLTLT